MELLHRDERSKHIAQTVHFAVEGGHRPALVELSHSVICEQFVGDLVRFRKAEFLVDQLHFFQVGFSGFLRLPFVLPPQFNQLTQRTAIGRLL